MAHDALTDLLGDTRQQIVARIQQDPATATELAEHLEVSPAAVRRHLTAMQADGLLDSATEHDGGMGRPAERWTLTSKGRRLFADRSAEFADELLGHIEQTYGRAAVADFLKTRNARKADDLARVLADVADPTERVTLLAQALSADGFAARVETSDDQRSLTLLQGHCAIEGIAKEHPEICAHEAALFKKVLGAEHARIKVSRRDTIAGGANACVCHIEVPEAIDATQATETDATSAEEH